MARSDTLKYDCLYTKTHVSTNNHYHTVCSNAEDSDGGREGGAGGRQEESERGGEGGRKRRREGGREGGREDERSVHKVPLENIVHQILKLLV